MPNTTSPSHKAQPAGRHDAPMPRGRASVEETGYTGAAGQTQREVEDRFIQCWGEIGGLWGVNRTISRIHALLFLSPEPLHMDAIAQRLGISHGNASTSIRDLLAWGVVRRVHPASERKVHYESEQDPWTWFHACIRERRRREVAPVVETLHEVSEFARAQAAADKGADKAGLEHVRERVESFTRFTDEFMDLIDAFLSLGHGRMGKAFLGLAKLMPKGRSPK